LAAVVPDELSLAAAFCTACVALSAVMSEALSLGSD